MRMIADGDVGLNEKPEDTNYIKNITSNWDPKHRQFVQTKDLISNFVIIGNCRLGNEQDHHSLKTQTCAESISEGVIA